MNEKRVVLPNLKNLVNQKKLPKQYEDYLKDKPLSVIGNLPSLKDKMLSKVTKRDESTIEKIKFYDQLVEAADKVPSNAWVESLNPCDAMVGNSVTGLHPTIFLNLLETQNLKADKKQELFIENIELMVGHDWVDVNPKQIKEMIDEMKKVGVDETFRALLKKLVTQRSDLKKLNSFNKQSDIILKMLGDTGITPAVKMVFNEEYDLESAKVMNNYQFSLLNALLNQVAEGSDSITKEVLEEKILMISPRLEASEIKLGDMVHMILLAEDSMGINGLNDLQEVCKGLYAIEGFQDLDDKIRLQLMDRIIQEVQPQDIVTALQSSGITFSQKPRDLKIMTEENDLSKLLLTLIIRGANYDPAFKRAIQKYIVPKIQEIPFGIGVQIKALDYCIKCLVNRQVPEQSESANDPVSLKIPKQIESLGKYLASIVPPSKKFNSDYIMNARLDVLNMENVDKVNAYIQGQEACIKRLSDPDYKDYKEVYKYLNLDNFYDTPEVISDTYATYLAQKIDEKIANPATGGATDIDEKIENPATGGATDIDEKIENPATGGATDIEILYSQAFCNANLQAAWQSDNLKLFESSGDNANVILKSQAFDALNAFVLQDLNEDDQMLLCNLIKAYNDVNSNASLKKELRGYYQEASEALLLFDNLLNNQPELLKMKPDDFVREIATQYRIAKATNTLADNKTDNPFIKRYLSENIDNPKFFQSFSSAIILSMNFKNMAFNDDNYERFAKIISPSLQNGSPLALVGIQYKVVTAFLPGIQVSPEFLNTIYEGLNENTTSKPELIDLLQDIVKLCENKNKNKNETDLKNVLGEYEKYCQSYNESPQTADATSLINGIQGLFGEVQPNTPSAQESKSVKAMLLKLLTRKNEQSSATADDFKLSPSEIKEIVNVSRASDAFIRPDDAYRKIKKKLPNVPERIICMLYANDVKKIDSITDALNELFADTHLEKLKHNDQFLDCIAFSCTKKSPGDFINTTVEFFKAAQETKLEDFMPFLALLLRSEDSSIKPEQLIKAQNSLAENEDITDGVNNWLRDELEDPSSLINQVKHELNVHILNSVGVYEDIKNLFNGNIKQEDVKGIFKYIEEREKDNPAEYRKAAICHKIIGDKETRTLGKNKDGKGKHTEGLRKWGLFNQNKAKNTLSKKIAFKQKHMTTVGAEGAEDFLKKFIGYAAKQVGGIGNIRDISLVVPDDLGKKNLYNLKITLADNSPVNVKRDNDGKAIVKLKDFVDSHKLGNENRSGPRMR